MLRTMSLYDARVGSSSTAVEVTEYRPDFNDLAECVALTIRADFAKRPQGCWYWNPRYSAYCSHCTKQFLHTARRCQRHRP